MDMMLKEAGGKEVEAITVFSLSITVYSYRYRTICYIGNIRGYEAKGGGREGSGSNPSFLPVYNCIQL